MTKRKFYLLYCDFCNWKRVTDGSDIDDLYELATAPIPGGVPKWDTEKKKIIESPSKKQKRKFRCPGCGRVLTAKPAKDPQAKIEQYREEQKKQEDALLWQIKDALDKARYDEVKRKYEEERNQLDAG